MTEDRSKRRFLSVIFTVLILLISFPLICSYDMLVFAQLSALSFSFNDLFKTSKMFSAILH